MPGANKKLRHSVARSYLRAWADKANLIYCLQDAKIIHPNIHNVAADDDFYKLKYLGPDDVDFVRKSVIDRSRKHLAEIQERILSLYCPPYEMKKQMEASGTLTPEAERRIEKMIDERNDEIHTSISEDFLPYLRMLREGDSTFLKSSKDAGSFLHGLAAQYMRTNHIKGARRRMTSENFERYDRIANVTTLMLSASVSFSLSVAREESAASYLKTHPIHRS